MKLQGKSGSGPETKRWVIRNRMNPVQDHNRMKAASPPVQAENIIPGDENKQGHNSDRNIYIFSLFNINF